MNSKIETTGHKDDQLSIGLASSRRGLYLSCIQIDDRFAHEIGMFEGNLRQRILSSLEGNPNDTWPTSPPLQQVHKQQVDSSPAILAVGMSGTSHYSTSMLIANTESSSELKIESACCTKSTDPFVWLGSRLQIEPEFSFAPTVEGGGLIGRESGQPKVLLTVDPASSAVNVVDQVIEIAPIQIEKSGTTQWKYQFRLQS